MDPSELALFVREFTEADETRARRIYVVLREAVDNMLTTHQDNPEGDPTQLAEAIWLSNCIACKFDVLMGHPIVDDAPTCRVDSLNLVLTPRGMPKTNKDNVENLFERVHQSLAQQFAYDDRMVRVFDELLRIHTA